MNYVPFKTMLNKGSLFNTTVFTARDDGYFWFHLSVLTRSPFVNISLTSQTTKNVKKLYKQSWQSYSLFVEENMFSYDEIMQVSSNEMFYVESKSSIDKDDFSQTTFSGFRVDEDIMKPFVARRIVFKSGNGKTSFTGIGFRKNWPWDDENDGEFIRTAVDGIFVISTTIWFTEGATSEDTEQFVMSFMSFSNGKEAGQNTIAANVNTYFPGKKTETATTSLLMLQLKKDEKLFVIANGINRFALNFLLYAPRHNERLAWFVQCVTNNEQEVCSVNVNEGSVWDSVEEVVRIPRDGIYFVGLTAMFQINVPQHVYVMLNKRDTIVNIVTRHYGPETLLSPSFSTWYQSTLTQLSKDDELCTGSLASTICTFNVGFLLYPT